jgi:hypothetical protein
VALCAATSGGAHDRWAVDAIMTTVRSSVVVTARGGILAAAKNPPRGGYAASLGAWSGSQGGERLAAGDDWQDTGLVFINHLGAAGRGNVRKMFKRV